MYDKEHHHLIWSNCDLNYERDWKADLEQEYFDMTESEREMLMYEINDDYLYDERANLNIPLGMPIIVIADLGLWDGRKKGYKVIGTGNVSDCLYDDCDYLTWYVDELGDLCCDATHHDGTNFYLYRVFRGGTTERQMESFKQKIYNGTVTWKDIARTTKKIGPYIAKVYGWNRKGE